jgi:hypothetical protein
VWRKHIALHQPERLVLDAQITRPLIKGVNVTQVLQDNLQHRSLYL